MRAVSLVALVGACHANPVPAAPIAPVAVPAVAPPADTEIDRGTFAVLEKGKPAGKEAFSITRKGDRLVLRSATQPTSQPPSTGELETDLEFHPIRAAFRRSGISYTLAGTPLTITQVRDDARRAEPVVATGTIDLFIDGPGVIAIAPLCTAKPGVTLQVLAPKDSFPKDTVQVRPAKPAGALQYIGVDFDTEVPGEVYCDGARLIAFGIDVAEVWFVREGREQDFATAKAAAATK